MNKHGNIKCVACGSEDMRLHVGYDGCDWNSVKGEGSGFKYCIDLVCEDCGRCYPICRTNNEFAICDVADLKKTNKL